MDKRLKRRIKVLKRIRDGKGSIPDFEGLCLCENEGLVKSETDSEGDFSLEITDKGNALLNSYEEEKQNDPPKHQ